LSSKILIVEPSYRSKFPPLGLMRISTFHKDLGDEVTFIRGTNKYIREQSWDRIYVSSLFTYDLPKTVETINYYSKFVERPKDNIIVGGIGATLLPEYIEEKSQCKIITGLLDYSNALGLNENPIAELIPDYDIVSSVKHEYRPINAYFTRVSIGCIRKCKFCAVPILEPNFKFLQNITLQVNQIINKFGEKQDLIVLDNNILALENIIEVIHEIKALGFERSAKFEGRLRFVDFNQGIDARLITPDIAKALGKINIRPVRLAFDDIRMENSYKKAIRLLAEQDFRYFTTYVLYNFNDNPKQFYERLRKNIELSKKHSIRITSFPMRFVPIDSVNRYHISDNWNWKFLRGVQCILNATHGMVSPLEDFFNIAFGKSYKEFIEILSMPDNYIIYRNKFKEQANLWRQAFNRLSNEELQDLYDVFNLNHHNAYKYTFNNSNLNTLLYFYKNRGIKNLRNI